MRYRIRLANGSRDLVVVDDRGVVTYSPWAWAAWMPWEEVRAQLADFGHVVEPDTDGQP